MATTGEPQVAEEPVHESTGFNAGFLYAGIWIVFLTVPVFGIVYGDADLVWRIVGFVSVGFFSLLYLGLGWRFFTWEDQDKPVTGPQLTGGVLLLAGVSALAIPAAGPWVSAFTPYMAALVIYTQPARIGMPVGVLIWLVPSLTAYILDGFDSFWTIGGPGIAMAFIIVIWVTDYQESKSRSRAEQLRQAEERDQIARDVHDVLGHSLTVLNVKAQLARRLIDTDPDRAHAELEAIEELTRESLSQVRSTVTRLKAPHLQGELGVAASTLESAGITSKISSTLEGDGPPVLAWALREAITNVIRHSGATQCEIIISDDRLRVVDDGVGLGETREGNGLRGLRERAKQAGASVVTGRAYPELEGATPERPGTMLEVRL